MESDTAQSSPFVKSLASSNSHTRREAVASLQQYLRSHGVFTQLELLKLWKGLFYCMWMSDRPKAQQQLARDLANLTNIIQRNNVLGWLEAFWTTISREWNAIDALRMNKFLYLVRQYILATFRHLSYNSWADRTTIADHLSLLEAIPLNPTDDRISNGIRYHVMDVYIDELDKVDQDRQGDMPVETLLQPIRNLLKNSPTKSIKQRAEETLTDDRLKDWNGSVERDRKLDILAQTPGNKITSLGEDEKDWSDEEWEGIDDD